MRDTKKTTIYAERICGGRGCVKSFSIDTSKGTPAIAFCPECDQRMRDGIERTLYLETGYGIGRYNSLDAEKE